MLRGGIGLLPHQLLQDGSKVRIYCPEDFRFSEKGEVIGVKSSDMPKAQAKRELNLYHEYMRRLHRTQKENEAIPRSLGFRHDFYSE